jgi:hypothetical protein
VLLFSERGSSRVPTRSVESRFVHNSTGAIVTETEVRSVRGSTSVTGH